MGKSRKITCPMTSRLILKIKIRKGVRRSSAYLHRMRYYKSFFSFIISKDPLSASASASASASNKIQYLYLRYFHKILLHSQYIRTQYMNLLGNHLSIML
jgi:hypothetical protein